MSSDANDIELDIAVVASGSAPPLPGGAELAALALTLTTDTVVSPTAERNAVAAALGDAAAERAVGVVATFQMMNRLLDGVGAPVAKDLHGIAAELGFDPADIPR